AVADELGADSRLAHAGGARGPFRRAVCQAAFGRFRNARRRDLAQLPRRPGERRGIRLDFASRGSATVVAWARAFGDDDELRARAGRWRFRRPAPSRILESLLGGAF